MWKWFRDFLGGKPDAPPRPRRADLDTTRARAAHDAAVGRARRMAREPVPPSLEDLRRAAREGRSTRVVTPTSDDLRHERRESRIRDEDYPEQYATDHAYSVFAWTEPPTVDVEEPLRWEAPEPPSSSSSYDGGSSSSSYDGGSSSSSYDGGSSSSSYDGGSSSSSYGPD